MRVKNHREFKQWLNGKPRQLLTVGGKLYDDCLNEHPEKIAWVDKVMVDAEIESFYYVFKNGRSDIYVYDSNLEDYEFVPHDSYSLLVEHFRTSNAA